ncbi:DNA mismatch repair protein MLH3-like isoform X2 [Solanum dulcamara]|uniref:DNA mismatch repair protein MLH3-like isoform X2 n=1 Tax=Solanum dulcamara TaxID=45834 RepID=UPI00248590A7|nr:DNA mismatch repair protein MLH3-like isoform X2 [Solanum dulcamara]
MLPFTPATSKYGHSDDMHAFPASFGFKGEALSYISDVSLLEIVTKTHWRPNEFCKDGKCLCLGVGTTGFGISRDGLVLMGGRYATSKYCHSYDMHAFPASFGLKGEALSSTSDISLLEIVTKTHGRPNGYCKVFKSLFVMYFTTNQFKGSTCTPSPKRVLHSMKEYLLRITLVHSNVSYNFVDIDRRATPSSLPLLSAGFGIHLSSLNKLNASDGSFKLSGYISGFDVYTVNSIHDQIDG